MADVNDRLPPKITREQMEILAVQMAEARKTWDEMVPGTTIAVPREMLMDLADQMLEFSYYVLGWSQ